ncbi:DNA-binding protein [Bacillus sp. BH2]|uniref:DNA-binding protein n=1 Tax=Bacillus sp. BH2 TaxID=2528958 RepID=UPI001066DFDE|nr:DNA-binding protein [Bacillus sp. BH2]TEA45644.1 DNA-binding protein [Bacillus sp. BH2]
MKEIDKYMFLQEAAIRWGIPYETVKNKVKPSLAKEEQIDSMIERGLIKYFEPLRDPNRTYKRDQKSWLVSIDAMHEWFGEPKNKK